MRATIFVVLLLLAGCATDTGTREAHALVARGALLLDVRTPEEFAADHAERARNVPVEQLAASLDALGPRDRPIVVYCHSGGRAGVATAMLRRAGFRHVYNVGSLARWRRDLPPAPSIW